MDRDESQMKKSQSNKEWLSGIKVVDLCNVIAGPVISHVLSRFGCDVVKVDMGKPSYDASITTLLGLPANRGKKSVRSVRAENLTFTLHFHPSLSPFTFTLHT